MIQESGSVDNSNDSQLSLPIEQRKAMHADSLDPHPPGNHETPSTKASQS